MMRKVRTASSLVAATRFQFPTSTFPHHINRRLCSVLGRLQSLDGHHRQRGAPRPKGRAINTKINLFMRKKPGMGFKKVPDPKAGSTVGSLKEFVVGELNKETFEDGFVLDATQIRVYYEAKQLGMLVNVEDVERTLEEKATYVAIEYFTNVPTTLLRTVKLDQLEPMVHIHPELTPQWTKVSPLYTAAFSHKKPAFPPVYLVSIKDGKERKVKVSGISLRSRSDATQSVDIDPFRPMEEEEDKGFFSISPSYYYDNLVPEEDKNSPNFHHENLQILHTSLTHYSNPNARVELLPQYGMSKMEEGGRKRDFWFRYKLEKGNDLTPFGMALVCDNSSEMNGVHFSLIRTHEGESPQHWGLLSNKDFNVVWPNNVQFTDPPEDATLSEVLLPTAENQPETDYHHINGHVNLTVPKLAARFEFHDFLFKASAEPQPLEKFNNEEQCQMYKAALVVYHLGDGEANSALEEMEKAGYELESVESTCRQALLEKMDDIFHEMDWESVDTEWGVDMDPCEELMGAIKILENVDDPQTLPPETPMQNLVVETQSESPDSNTTQATVDQSEEAYAASGSDDGFDVDVPVESTTPSSTTTEDSVPAA